MYKFFKKLFGITEKFWERDDSLYIVNCVIKKINHQGEELYYIENNNGQVLKIYSEGSPFKFYYYTWEEMDDKYPLDNLINSETVEDLKKWIKKVNNAYNKKHSQTKIETVERI